MPDIIMLQHMINANWKFMLLSSLFNINMYMQWKISQFNEICETICETNES